MAPKPDNPRSEIATRSFVATPPGVVVATHPRATLPDAASFQVIPLVTEYQLSVHRAAHMPFTYTRKSHKSSHSQTRLPTPSHVHERTHTCSVVSVTELFWEPENSRIP